MIVIGGSRHGTVCEIPPDVPYVWLLERGAVAGSLEEYQRRLFVFDGRPGASLVRECLVACGLSWDAAAAHLLETVHGPGY